MSQPGKSPEVLALERKWLEAHPWYTWYDSRHFHWPLMYVQPGASDPGGLPTREQLDGLIGTFASAYRLEPSAVEIADRRRRLIDQQEARSALLEGDRAFENL